MPDAAAIQAIEHYVRTCGRDHAQWCVGVAADPMDRLLRGHGVAEEGDGCGWITYRCATSDAARDVRDHFVAKGMKPATADPDLTAASAVTSPMTSPMTSVYAFKITGTTRP